MVEHFNKYDDPVFFERYKQMGRSQRGLEAAGEWHELEKMLPDFKGKRVLDMGCGYGWHCVYAAEHGAKSILGIDCSVKMLEVAKSKTKAEQVTYEVKSIEDMHFPKDSFDAVISSLAFHYVESFEDICAKVKACLVKGGDFVFSVENPVFTANSTQDWYCNEDGERLHWPVDNYFTEGIIKTNFLNNEVYKYHKTMSTYINTLIKYGFQITKVVEPYPDEINLRRWPDEGRRPMMILFSAILQ